MNNNINNILEKYWNAETSLQEEAELCTYFASEDVADEHKEYADLFSHFSQEQLVSSDLDVGNIINTVNDIDSLLLKYSNANTSLVEENILKAYFSGDDISQEHLDYKSLFDFYKTAGQMTTDIKFNIETISVDTNIDSLLNKYLNAETTIDEEKTLSAYFQNGSIQEAHIEYKPLFAFFDQAANMSTDLDIASIIGQNSIDIDNLLEKYWNAETSLDEEETLHTYFAGKAVSEKHIASKDLFYFYANQKSVESNLDLEQLFNKEESNSGNASTDTVTKPQASEAKVITLRKMATAIAAIFVLGFAAVTVMNQTAETETQYKGKYVQLDEEAEAKEAYEITKQAFALLSKKMNKSSKTIKRSMKKAENASIFK